MSRPCTPRTANQDWNDIEAQVGKLTTLGSRSRPKSEDEAIVASIHKTLARLRGRQDNLMSLFLSQPASAEATVLNAEGDADLQKLRQKMQENTIMRTQIYQNQRLLAEREAEASRLTQQVEDSQRRCDALEQQSLRIDIPAVPDPAVLAEVRTEATRARERLADIQKRTLEKESLLRRAQQDLHEDALRTSLKSSIKARSSALENERRDVEEKQAAYAMEAADCNARREKAAAERRESEQRLKLLRLSLEQIQSESNARSAEAAALREQLERKRAECRRLEQRAQLDAEELVRLRISRPPSRPPSRPASRPPFDSFVESTTSTSSRLRSLTPRRTPLRTPPEIGSSPSRTPPEVSRAPSKNFEAHPDLADKLNAASAHNEWLREQIAQLSSSRCVPPQAATSCEALAPPEATPEVAALVRPRAEEPRLDSTILALEAQMKALAAQNQALECSS